jgi:release factor glutamine methyltransferase
MASDLDIPSFDDVVRRLRAAGCVFAEDEARLVITEARSPAQLAEMIELRIAGRPLELVLGWAEFAGLRIVVEPGVFVPRRRTELLVQEAVALVRATARDRARRVVVVDLCCGSGAVGVALATELAGDRHGNPAQVELHAADVDPAAVRCARRNVATVGGHVYEGDLDDPLPATLLGAVDVLVANAPYVPTDAIRLMPPEARDHEPRVALDGGTDGLDVQRRVIAVAPRWLAPGGHLLIETSRRQAPLTAAAIGAIGLVARVVTSDDLDATVVVGSRPDRAGVDVK